MTANQGVKVQTPQLLARVFRFRFHSHRALFWVSFTRSFVRVALARPRVARMRLLRSFTARVSSLACVCLQSTEMAQEKRALAGKLIVAGDRSLAFLALMDSARWRKSLEGEEALLSNVQAAIAQAERTGTFDRHCTLHHTIREIYKSTLDCMEFEKLPVPGMGSEERKRYEAELTKIVDNALTEAEEADVEDDFRALIQEVKQLEEQ